MKPSLKRLDARSVIRAREIPDPPNILCDRFAMAIELVYFIF